MLLPLGLTEPARPDSPRERAGYPITLSGWQGVARGCSSCSAGVRQAGCAGWAQPGGTCWSWPEVRLGQLLPVFQAVLAGFGGERELLMPTAPTGIFPFQCVHHRMVPCLLAGAFVIRLSAKFAFPWLLARRLGTWMSSSANTLSDMPPFFCLGDKREGPRLIGC